MVRHADQARQATVHAKVHLISAARRCARPRPGQRPPGWRACAAIRAALPKGQVVAPDPTGHALPGHRGEVFGRRRHRPRSCRRRSTAAASGCSLPRSSAAAQTITWVVSKSSCATSPVSAGLRRSGYRSCPSTRGVDLLQCLDGSRVAESTPPARPPGRHLAIGWAWPGPARTGAGNDQHRHGVDGAWARRGCGPSRPTARRSPGAPAPPPARTRRTRDRPRRCSGARERCASATRRTICANQPRRRRPCPPAGRGCRPGSGCRRATRSPNAHGHGRSSPLSRDSSTWLAPSLTTPSHWHLLAGRTRSRSPTWTCSSGTSLLAPSASTRRAVLAPAQQGAQAAPGAVARAQLQPLAQRDQGDDHRRCLGK